jgi:hypothetical protein
MKCDLPTPRTVPVRAVKLAWLIGVATFVAYAYFYPGGGWNQNTRFDLIRAIVERRTLSIDAYQLNTGDKSIHDGRYYCDKAPGQPLMAVPVAMATRTAQRALGSNPSSAASVVALSYVCTLFTAALPAALACVCLFWIALRLGASTRAAAFAAFAMGLGSPMWAYATLLWAHALAGACLLFAFAAALNLDRVESGRDVFWGFVVGVAAGWAMVTEYPAAPASAILAWFAVTRVWNSGRSRRLRVACGVMMGGVVCVLALMLYLRAAFGSAFHTSYHYEVGTFAVNGQGFIGLKYPRIDVAFRLLFGSKRGLFYLAPVLTFAPFGMWLLWRQLQDRAATLAAASVFLYYLLFNASYGEWSGGWSYGPRYMAAGIPLLCVGLAPVWDYFSKSGRAILLTLLAVSVLFSLIAVATTPQPPFDYRSPMTQLLWPSFWNGNLALEHTSMLAAFDSDPGGSHGAFNLGQLLGLRGLTSLLPLFAFWGMTVLAWAGFAGRARKQQAPWLGDVECTRRWQ